MICAGVCSGISAPAAAWADFGWTWAFESEIEPFPCAVLKHHYPGTPNYGDMTNYKEWPDAAIDILIGGTPCQSFSVAGLRQGLDDPRGNLALTFIGLVDKYRPRWVIWENVPGVFSSGKGGDFQAFIDGMAVIGYFGAWRVLDAQWFGVAQRRRRVFAVFCPGDWRPAAAVLFEPESLRGDSAPSREKREKATGTLAARTGGGGGLGTDMDCDGGLVPEIANPLTARMHKGINTTLDEGQTPIVTHAFPTELSGTQCASTENLSPALSVAHSVSVASSSASAVRRLTPRECERLQGFPDDYTMIPWRNKPAENCPDGPRYKALGNSMAVPVVRWVGERIKFFDEVNVNGRVKC